VESYGQLAVLSTLLQVQQYFPLHSTCKLCFLLDNSGHILRTKKFLQSPRLAQRPQCLISNFDLDLKIRDTLKQVQISPSVKHVHIHQEDALQQQGEPLPWKVQIKSCCDEIATNYLRHQSQPVTKLTFLPASTIAVVVNSTTLTSRIPSQLHHHCSSTFQYKGRSQLQHL
jgi:hypothetical protein